jgi:hypothetical protein
MKTYVGVDVQIHVFLISALVWDELSTCPLYLPVPTGGGSMVTRAGLNDLKKNKSYI